MQISSERLSPGAQHDGAASQFLETIVVGGGQAGLAMGYELACMGQRFTILDAQDSIGAVWRRRWDSLRLFTSAAYSALPGLHFPAPPGSYPTKDAVADDKKERQMYRSIDRGERRGEGGHCA